MIPGDGTVIEGIASVDESAITGESAPVIRESGGDRSAVTGGTRVLSDRIVVEITQEPGHSFLDRMIALVEGAERRKTPNEIALSILLSGLTIVFLAVVVTLRPFALFAGTDISAHDAHRAARRADPDDDRRAAQRDRHRRHGPAGASQRAGAVRPRGRGVRRRRRAAARQDRHDHARQPAGGRVRPDARRSRGRARRGGAAGLARRRDARGALDRRAGQAVRHPRARACRARRRSVRAVHRADAHERRRPRRHAAAQGRRRRGHRAGSATRAARRQPSCRTTLDRIGREGGTPLAVARDTQVLGVVYLKDTVKEGMRRALRPAARDGHPHGHGHRRQPAHRGEDRRGGRASTTSSPRRRPSASSS